MNKLTAGLITAVALAAVPGFAQNDDDQVNLRAIHAVPGAPAANISIGTTSLFSNVEFKQATAFKPLPKQDDQTVRITLADGRQLETKEQFSFDDDDEKYTILIVPDDAGYRNPKVVALKGDDDDDIDADETELTLINASPNHKALAIFLNDNRLEGGVNYGQADDEDVKPGTYNVRVVDTSNDTPVVSRSVTLQGGTSVSVIVMGQDAVKIINDDSPEKDLSGASTAATAGTTTGSAKTTPATGMTDSGSTSSM